MEPNYEQLNLQLDPFLRDLGTELEEFYLEKKSRGMETPQIAYDADHHSENKIRGKIHSLFPDHNILGEEEGLSWKDSEYTWVVDPIDGTSNYSNGCPFWGISLGLCREKKIIFGAIYLPFNKKYYHAVDGGGAYLNGHRIETLKEKEYKSHHLIGTCFYPILRTWNHSKVRILGSTVIDMVYLAEGTYMAFYEPEPRIWDMIAGYLIAREAGGIISRVDGKSLESFDFKSTAPFELVGKANPQLPDLF